MNHPSTHPVTHQQFNRLLALLALSPDERAFLQSALTASHGDSFWAILADYLEEKDVACDPARFREYVRPQRAALKRSDDIHYQACHVCHKPHLSGYEVSGLRRNEVGASICQTCAEDLGLVSEPERSE